MTFTYDGFTFETIDDVDSANIQSFATEAIDQLTRRPVNAPAGSSYTLTLPDAKKLITPASASPFSLMVPTNASVGFTAAPATFIPILNLGAGLLTVTPVSGTVVISGPSLTLAQDRLGILIKVATNLWVFHRGVNLAGDTFTGVVNVLSNPATGSTSARQITISTAAPSGGADGDLWVVYV